MNDNSMECQLCGSVGPHRLLTVREMMFGSREQFIYFSCKNCQSLQSVAIPDDEVLARYYGAGYYAHNESARLNLPGWLAHQQDRHELRMGRAIVGAIISGVLPERIVRAVISGNIIKMIGQLQIERGARILDIGCGSGALLDRLKRLGFTNLSGADPFISEDGATPLGVPLAKRHLSELSGEYDVIMFNHSLEHVRDFVGTLKAAREKLSVGGCCLVRVPTTSSEAWDVYQENWVDIDAPRHIVIPSRQGMAVAAESAGLRLDRVFEDSTFFQFIASEAYRRDVELSDPKLFWKMLRVFGAKQLWDWEKQAEQLNSQGRGDRVGFVVRLRQPLNVA